MRAEPLVSRLHPQTIFDYEQCLQGDGEVLVAPGNWVRVGDALVRGEEPAPVRVIDGAEALGLACEQLYDSLRVAVGQEVQAGDVLAAAGFMGWRTLRTPVAGRVTNVATGRIFIQEAPRRVELRAPLPGQVVRVLPRRGAVVRSTVARVLGLWGAGGEIYGALALRTRGPADSLRWTSVDVACRGKIVVGGLCLDSRVLLRAARFRAAGLLVGGLAQHLRARAEQLGLTVLVTDGLGAVPMAGPIFDLLAQHDGCDALLEGGRRGSPAGYPQPLGRLGWCHGQMQTPALSIPLKVAGELDPAAAGNPTPGSHERPLVTGDRVRLTRTPYLGMMGWVQSLQEQDGEALVGVTLDGGQTVQVPYRNLERLG